MTDWICKEIPMYDLDCDITDYFFEPVCELIRCKDCKYYDHGENPSESWSVCTTHINRYFQTCAENYCAWAERKEE